MRTIIHRTPTLLAPEAMTVMGLSSKPNSANPIGQFGTGLKYAISVLVRSGAKLSIWIGRDEYVFSTRKKTFRDDIEYDQIVMRRRRFGLTGWHTIVLPFTTNYGKFWETWMVFRELEANTRDENGDTFEVDNVREASALITGTPDDIGFAREGYTTIVIEYDEYAEAYDNRNQIFLPVDHMQEVAKGAYATVYRGSCRNLYYRTLRAMNVQKPTMYTYNFTTSMDLTEDRFMNEWWTRWHLANQILRSDDEKFIESIITCDETHWEHGLEFGSHIVPSDAFKEVVRRNPRNLWLGARMHVDSHTPRDYSKARPWDEHGRPWSIDTKNGQITDVNGLVIFEKPEKMEAEPWAELASSVMVRVNRLFLPTDMPPALEAAYKALMTEEEAIHAPEPGVVWSRFVSALEPGDPSEGEPLVLEGSDTGFDFEKDIPF